MLRKKSFRFVAATALPLALMLGACSQQPEPEAPAASDSTAPAAKEILGNFTGDDTVPEAVDQELDVALVTRITTGSWYETYEQAVKSEVADLGGSLQVYDSNNDLATMASNVDTAVNSGADILLINNGTIEALESSVQKALDANIPVVTYDSDIDLDGVVAINQDDAALATNGLEAIAQDYSDKANMVVLSVAGYAPLDRRLEAVDAFVADHPGIEIVTQTGTVSGNASLDTAAQISALLKANPDEGEIDVIWSHWNEFTRGAFTALQEAGRDDIGVYTVDLTDQELPFFWDETVNFQAASATNPASIGRSQVRLGYVLAAGEQAQDLAVSPVLITKADLPEAEISYTQLAEYVPAWNQDDSEWPAWIRTLLER